MIGRLATLAILVQACLISATDLCAQQAKSEDPTPNCNPIQLPGLHDIVQGAKPYTIRWANNTGTTVSLVLCEGPATNITEIGCIVDHAPNTGTFVWIPATDLVPDGDHNYGLKIIANTGDFQWSDQFGIANSVETSSSSSKTSATSTPSKKAIKESSKTAKHTTRAVKQTGSTETKKYTTKSSSSTIKSHTVSNSSATAKHISAHIVVHQKGANATYSLTHTESRTSSAVIATSVAKSAIVSVKAVSTPIVASGVTPTTPSTTVAPTTTVALSTSLKTSFSAGGAVRAAFTGAPLVLGAIAALVL